MTNKNSFNQHKTGIMGKGYKTSVKKKKKKKETASFLRKL